MFLNSNWHKPKSKGFKKSTMRLLPSKMHFRCHACKRCATCEKFHGVPLAEPAYCKEHGK